MPNNDVGASLVRDAIFRNKKADTWMFNNLTRPVFLSILKHCKAVIGNSSCGLLEAPTYDKPALNIGNRQQGRFQGRNVVNCEYEKNAICNSLKLISAPEFSSKLATLKDRPYGSGDSAEKILRVLIDTESDKWLLAKTLTY